MACTYCDAEHRPRGLSQQDVLFICNMVSDMHRCTNQEHVKTFENELERVIGDRRRTKISLVINDTSFGSRS